MEFLLSDLFTGTIGTVILLILIVWVVFWFFVPFAIITIRDQSKKQTKQNALIIALLQKATGSKKPEAPTTIKLIPDPTCNMCNKYKERGNQICGKCGTKLVKEKKKEKGRLSV